MEEEEKEKEGLALTTTARLLFLSQRSEGDREDLIRQLIEPQSLKNISVDRLSHNF